MAANSLVRSALFVPATRPERIDKALASGADAVIVDLEDAVAPEDKARARDNVRAYMNANAGARICLRINPIGSPEHEADLALGRRETISHIVLPKAASGKGFEKISGLGKPVWPLVESAAGLVGLAELLAQKNIERLLLGDIDLAQDLDMAPDSPNAGRALEAAGFQLVVHSRAAGIAAPLHGVYQAFNDEQGLHESAANARALGFGGKLCIHPKQVATVNKAFSPTESEVQWAKSVLKAAENAQTGVFVLDGKMIDAPVLNMARRIVDREVKE